VVQLVDLYPTLLHLAGGPPATGPGRNLSALLRGQKPDGAAPPAYAEENLDNHQLQALIAGSRKIIADAARPAPLVFDLAQDPGEHRPLPDPALHDLLALETIRNSTEAAAQRGAPRLVQPTELPDSVRQALRALGYGQPGKE